jgi:hypothetical protein
LEPQLDARGRGGAAAMVASVAGSPFYGMARPSRLSA